MILTTVCFSCWDTLHTLSNYHFSCWGWDTPFPPPSRGMFRSSENLNLFEILFKSQQWKTCDFHCWHLNNILKRLRFSVERNIPLERGEEMGVPPSARKGVIWEGMSQHEKQTVVKIMKAHTFFTMYFEITSEKLLSSVDKKTQNLGICKVGHRGGGD